MEEETLKKMLDELFSKKITKTGSTIGSYESHIVQEEARIVVEHIIREYLLANRDNTIAVLEAKVYAYEKIIANSNFAAILPTNTRSE